MYQTNRRMVQLLILHFWFRCRDEFFKLSSNQVLEKIQKYSLNFSNEGFSFMNINTNNIHKRRIHIQGDFGTFQILAINRNVYFYLLNL